MRSQEEINKVQILTGLRGQLTSDPRHGNEELLKEVDKQLKKLITAKEE